MYSNLKILKMKKSLLSTLLLLSIVTFGQNDSINVGVPTLNDYLNNVDKFTGEKTYYSDLLAPVGFSKHVNKNTNYQYVYVKAYGYALSYDNAGVYILFDDGQKIVRSKEKVRVGVNYGGGPDWEYTSSFVPTQNEINLLKTRKIVTVKVDIYSLDVDATKADEIQVAAKVMLKSHVLVKKKKKK